jgi:hypothetical protein
MILAAARFFLFVERELNCPKNLSIILRVTLQNIPPKVAAASRNPQVRIFVPQRINRWAGTNGAKTHSRARARRTNQSCWMLAPCGATGVT